MTATHFIRMLVFVIVLLSTSTIHAQRLVNSSATQETKNLKAYMDDIYGQKIISGQYWDTYATWIKNLTGKTPAILGLDFMDYMPRRKQEGAKPTDTQKAIDWVNNKKGIVTFSWHWDAPADIYDVNYRQECAGTTGGDARWYKAFYSCAVWFDLQNALANPGSTNYNLLIRDIDLVAAELKILQDNNVPVLWRPLHESSGQWFWWGAKGAGPCKELWKLMYDRLVNHHKLNNLIWVWNCYGYEHGNPTDWFPGYDYVDIIAYDYPRSTSWNEYNTIHGNKGKEFALAEVGGLPNPNDLAAQGWSYFVTWGDFIQNNNSEAYVKQVYTDPRVITLESLPDLKNYLPVGVNIALHKPVSVSSTEAGLGNVAGNAVDGNAATRWSSVYADPQWIQVDLQGTYQLSEIRLKWENAFASAYTIETSADGVTWNTVKQITNGDGGLDIIGGLTTTGRYIRVTGTTRATQYGYSLYEIEVYGNESCSATITAQSTSFCQGGSVTLTANTGSSYIWKNGITTVGTSATFNATAAGSYTVEVTNAAGCKATSSTTTVTVNAAQTANITANGATTFCQGGSVTLAATTGSSYIWKNGTTTVGTSATYNATTAGSYTVEVTNANGCKATSAATTVNVESASVWYQDLDNDGIGDAVASVQACTKPTGYVATSGDTCPLDALKREPGNCGCGNTEQSCVDCAGIANGTAALDVCDICSGGTTGRTPVTDVNLCNVSTGINQLQTMEKIRVAPNPFSDRLSVSIENILSYQLMDMNGRIVLEEQTSASSINTSGLANGLYILRIVTTTGIEFVKVEKQD
ncbi:glycosyl hydrolase [Cytophaga aurantiaca]|uniref:glycosyl hydrolase n=1 Tax=Cytophaga aurantiaca TaxID=29530 RepID=UPI00036F0E12|nr:glycosyl hydrolase [Cytophaga aurantiaca]